LFSVAKREFIFPPVVVSCEGRQVEVASAFRFRILSHADRSFIDAHPESESTAPRLPRQAKDRQSNGWSVMHSSVE